MNVTRLDVGSTVYWVSDDSKVGKICILYITIYRKNRNFLKHEVSFTNKHHDILFYSRKCSKLLE